MKKQSGFAILELLLIVVALVLIGFTATTYYNHTQTASDKTSPTAATATVPSPPQISSTADLTTAENMVDQMDISANNNDSSQLDSELANF